MISSYLGFRYCCPKCGKCEKCLWILWIYCFINIYVSSHINHLWHNKLALTQQKSNACCKCYIKNPNYTINFRNFLQHNCGSKIWFWESPHFELNKKEWLSLFFSKDISEFKRMYKISIKFSFIQDWVSVSQKNDNFVFYFLMKKTPKIINCNFAFYS